MRAMAKAMPTTKAILAEASVPVVETAFVPASFPDYEPG